MGAGRQLEGPNSRPRVEPEMSAALAEGDHPSVLPGLWNELVSAEADVADAVAHKEAVRAQIASYLEVGESYEARPGVGIKLADGNLTFNPIKAVGILAQADRDEGTDWLARTLRTMPDKDLARKHLPTRLYRECCDKGRPVLRRFG